MIAVARVPEPGTFDRDCRGKGNAWLAENPRRHPHEHKLWNDFEDDLRVGFADRCGVLAMYIAKGTVDHWQSIHNSRERAYDWANYRYLDFLLNSAKKPAWDGKLIDPYEVRDEWFEILLPSLQLVLTADIPIEFVDRAEFTIEKFRLRDGADVIRLRSTWLAMYEASELSLAGLMRMAPLIARAVAKRDGLSLP